MNRKGAARQGPGRDRPRSGQATAARFAAARRFAAERGIALVIAMLAILALAGIGAVVLVSVSAESHVARNERWLETAAAQAEAGLELGKALLAARVREEGSFESVLPPARDSVRVSAGSAWGVGRPADAEGCRDPQGPGCRDYESFLDQPTAGGNARIYVGRVLRGPDGQAFLFDPRAPLSGWAPDADGDGAPELTGVTVWVRRPVIGNTDAGPPHDRAILTAEARHPPPGTPDAPHAVSRLELTVRLARRPASEIESGDGYGDGLKRWATGKLPEGAR